MGAFDLKWVQVDDTREVKTLRNIERAAECRGRE